MSEVECLSNHVSGLALNFLIKLSAISFVNYPYALRLFGCSLNSSMDVCICIKDVYSKVPVDGDEEDIMASRKFCQCSFLEDDEILVRASVFLHRDDICSSNSALY